MTETPITPPDLPTFDPVPTVPRHDGWTPERQQRFIAALSLLGSVAGACRAVGLSSASAYKLRDRPDVRSFRRAWEVALAMGRDRAWDQAMDRASNGYTRPMRYRGKVVGQRHVFNDRLAYAIAYGEPMPNPFKAADQSFSRAASSTSGESEG